MLGKIIKVVQKVITPQPIVVLKHSPVKSSGENLMAPVDDDDEEDVWDEDDWDGADAAKKAILDNHPDLDLVQLHHFNAKKLMDVDDWCRDNVSLSRWKRIGWNGHCSTYVGVIFENKLDAMYFKLRWR